MWRSVAVLAVTLVVAWMLLIGVQSVRVSNYPRIPFDVATYVRRTRDNARTGSCFICSIVAGDLDGHIMIAKDDVSISFLAKSPTLLGYDP